jgi:hypothetical protein
MLFMPATEATKVNVLKQRFGALPAIVVEQRGSCDGRVGHHHDPCLRRVRVQSERSENDAGQQHAIDRSQRSHGHALVECPWNMIH